MTVRALQFSVGDNFDTSALFVDDPLQAIGLHEDGNLQVDGFVTRSKLMHTPAK